MAGLVGNVLELENPKEQHFKHKNFGRAIVEVDIEKSLVLGFLAPRPDLDLDDVWIQVKYEKLVKFCYNCGKLGHESKSCEEEVVEFMVNGVVRGYDSSLCAQQVRTLAMNQTNRSLKAQPEWRNIGGENTIEVGGSGALRSGWVTSECGGVVGVTRGSRKEESDEQPKLFNAVGHRKIGREKLQIGGA